MENISFSHISPAKASHLLRFICESMKRKDDKDQAKGDILEEIQKIKDYLATPGFRKKDVQHMLNLLQMDMAKALDKSSRVTDYRITINDGLSSFYRKVEGIEDELSRYTQAIQKREERIRELEKEIMHESMRRNPHHKKLKELEKRFLELENLNVYDVKQLSKVRLKIEGLKDALMEQVA